MSAAPSTGVWERWMTPGLKIQYRPQQNEESGEIEMVGEEYDFNEANLVQCVQNFSRTFSERRLVMDSGNHIAAEPGHTEVQELARYSGEAAIWGGKVVAFWDQFPDLPPPDPAVLLAALQEKFPRATSVDGLWGYRREVTALGEQLLPNMSQTSPQFSKDDTDEAGNLIGYNVSAVSPVYVAHQNGTVLMSKTTTMAQPSSGVHAPRPLGDETMADEKKPSKGGEENPFSQEMRKALCAKMGLPEGADDNTIMGVAYSKFGAGSVDSDGDKDADASMGDGLIDHGLNAAQQRFNRAKAAYEKVQHSSDPKAVESAVRELEEARRALESSGGRMGKPVAMSDLPSTEVPGDIPAAANASTNFAKAGPAILAALSKRTEAAEKAAAAAQARLDAMEAEKHEAALATFSKWAVDEEGRWPDGDHAGCVAFAKKMGLAEAKAHILQHMPPRAAFGRQTQGGHPVGTAPAALKKGGDKAAAFSKKTWEIFTADAECVAMSKIPGKGNEAFALAQRKARAEMPESYDTEFRATN